jgi:hypothetical protein
LHPTEDGNDLVVVNLVRTDGVPELSHRLAAPLQHGELIVNLRAEEDPETLWRIVRSALGAAAAAAGVQVEILTHEFFRPAKPNPTWRMATA